MGEKNLVLGCGRELKILATPAPVLKLYIVENDDEDCEDGDEILFVVVDEKGRYIGETNRACLDEEYKFSLQEVFFETKRLSDGEKVTTNEQMSLKLTAGG